MAQSLDDARILEQKLRETAAVPAAASASAPAAAAPAAPASDPAWKSFSAEQLAAIESARAAARAAGPLVMDPAGTYGSICRACTKPNSVSVDFCTGCSFPAAPEDVVRLADNIFLELVRGKDIGAVVCHRDAEFVVFNDKFPVSENHLDVIPTAVYADCTVLTAEHIPMLERLYELGKAEFRSRSLPWLPSDADLDSLITAGYNYPVSVKHLHLHMVLPPFRHEKVFQYPRWHSHQKVIADLKTKGKVQLYCDSPNDAEGAAEYQRAMDNSARAQKMLEEYNAKHASAAAETK